ncbi:MAG: glycosyltransferase family 4 protein [Janthinobacterium lividum]
MSRRTALLLTPEVPSPSGSGLQQRAFAWVVRLAAEHAVTVLVWSPSVVKGREPCNLPGLTRQVDLASGSDLPRYSAGFDVCLVFRLRMHPVAQALRDSCEVREAWLDLDDIESGTLATIAWCAARRGRLRLALRSMRRAVHDFVLERHLPRLYSKVFVAAPEDRTRLAPGINVFCMPNRTALPVSTPTSSNAQTATMLFVGTLSYFPNEDAALLLATTLAPRLRRLYGSQFRIVIAGRGASERLRAELTQVPEIDFRGEVEHVAPLYQEAHIVVMPLRCGGGTKLKALEAIACRRSIVAFPQAMRGLGLRAGVDYLAADNTAKFANACLALLHDPARAAAMADAAAHRLLDADPSQDT